MTAISRSPAPTAGTAPPAGAAVPLALWPVGQIAPADQWAARYLPGSADDPGSMTPDLGRRIVAEYSQPGDLILDPHCGAGLIVVEAAVRGRRAIGVAGEDRWAALAVANCEHILPPMAWPLVEVITGDACRLSNLVGNRSGQVDLVVLAPPTPRFAGPGDEQGPGARLVGSGQADVRPQTMNELVTACRAVLRPGGLLVTVTSNIHGGRLIDAAGAAVTAAQAAGLDYLQHVIAVHTAIRDSTLTPIHASSTVGTQAVVDASPGGSLVVHHDVLVFRAPAKAAA